MFEGESGKGHARHYVIDFGSCFGSGSIQVQSKRAGNEYIIERRPIVKAAITFGIWDRPWRKFHYPKHPGIGRFEGDSFQPHLWRPEYPNPAFDRMLPGDAFWALRIIARFTDEMIAAVVETGEFADSRSADYLTETLIKRRDKILEHYLAQMLALDNFRIQAADAGSQEIIFDDIRQEASVPTATAYTYRWFSFDNQQNQLTPLESSGQASISRGVPLPRMSVEFLMVRLSDSSDMIPGHVDLYLRNRGADSGIVGIERHFE